MRNLLLILILMTMSCGPVVPERIDVVVSGGIEVKPSLSELTGFFMKECKDRLGSSASDSDIQSCVGTEINKLLTFLEGLNK